MANQMMSNNTTVVMAPAAPPPTTTVIVQNNQNNCCRQAIPALHIAGAIIACLFDIVIPGFGTILAGFFVFCCGNPGDDIGAKFACCCLNFFIGLLQFLLAGILIGWIWSWIWACALVGMSAEYHNSGSNTTVVTPAAPAPAAPIVINNSSMMQSQAPAPVQQAPMQQAPVQQAPMPGQTY